MGQFSVEKSGLAGSVLSGNQHLFLSAAGPYKGLAEPERLLTLAERIEEHVSTEHANWFDETRRAAVARKAEGA